jgi:nucleoside-diphosphate-sugar epimerase
LKGPGKVIVTGGAGFIGSKLVGALLRQGVETVVFDNFSSGSVDNLAPYKESKLMKVVRGDVRRMRKDLPALDGVDHMFHFAAIASVAMSVAKPIRVHDVNVNGSLEAMSFCLDRGIKRLVFASSAAVYGPLKASIATEDLPCSPASPYGASKLAVENYMSSYHQSYGLETVALRFFNVYGAGQRLNDYSGVITLFASSLLRRQPPTVYGDGKQTRDFVSVKDVVQASILAMSAQRAPGQVINIASGKTVSLLQLLDILRRLTGATDVREKFAPSRPGDVKFGRASISKAREILGYSPKVPIEEGLVEVVESLRHNLHQPGPSPRSAGAE